MITRPVAHQATDKLQMIVSAIELGRSKEAIAYVRELAQLINRHTETAEEEKARRARESER